jgi:hypothetical protein
MTPREARRLSLAEDTCRALRHAITTPHFDEAAKQRRWKQTLDYLNAWMNIGPKRFGLPTSRIRPRRTL